MINKCWQNYVDYYKCVNAKGEDFVPCRQFYHAYRALCPNAWLERWDTQRGLLPPPPSSVPRLVSVRRLLTRFDRER